MRARRQLWVWAVLALMVLVAPSVWAWTELIRRDDTCGMACCRRSGVCCCKKSGPGKAGWQAGVRCAGGCGPMVMPGRAAAGETAVERGSGFGFVGTMTAVEWVAGLGQARCAGRPGRGRAPPDFS